MFSLQNLIGYLADPWVEYFGLTFFATGFSLVTRVSSRPVVSIQREDWAVGFDLAQTAIFAILADATAETVHSIARGQFHPETRVEMKLVVLPFLLLCMVGLLFLAALIVRKYGWETPPGKGREPRLNRIGVSIPIPLGLLYMTLLVKWVRIS
jgi:hypothetical protein